MVNNGDKAQEILNEISAVVDGLISKFAQMPQLNIGDAFAGAADAMATIGGASEEVATGLEDVATSFEDVTTQAASFTDNLNLIGSGLAQLASNIAGVPFNNFITGVQNIGSKISDTVSGPINSFINGIQQIGSKIGDAVSGPINSFINGVQNVASKISDTVSGPINSFMDGIQQIGSRISDAASGPINSFISRIQDMASSISDATSGPLSNISSGISGLASNINDAASGAFSGFVEGVQNMSSAVMDFSEESLENAQNALSGFVSGIGDAASGMGDMFNSIGMGIMNFQMIGMQATQTATALLGPAESAETMKTAFATLMGSTKAATDEMTKLDAFASKTPFKTMDIDQAASQLIGFGINAKDVVPDLTSIGDALSAVGKGSTANLDSVVGIFGKISLQGKITSADMTQLSDRGINAWAILEQQTGKTQAQLSTMISKGLLPSKDAISDLTTGIEKSPLYSGGMAKQSATTAGLMSTLASNWDQVLAAFGSPILAALEPTLNNIGTALASPAFKQFASVMGTDIVNGVTGVIHAIGTLISDGQAVAGFFQHNQTAMDGLKAVLIGLGAGVLAFVATTIPALVAGFITWAITAGGAAVATLAAALPFIAIGAVVAAVAFGIIEAIQHWGAIMTWISGIVSDVVNAVTGFFKGLYDDLVGHSIIPDLVNGVVSLFNWLFSGLKTILSAIGDFFHMIWNGLLTAAVFIAEAIFVAITGPFGLLAIYIVTHWTQVHQWLVNAWNSLSSFASNAFNAVWNTIDNILGGWPAKALTWMQDMMNKIVQGIEDGIDAVGNAVQKIAGKIAGFLHFSKPDVGPLVDVDNWMPDFGDMLAKGMSDQVNKVSGASLKLATTMTMNLNPVSNAGLTALPVGVSGIPSSISQATSGVGSNQPIVINVNVAGHNVAKAVLPDLTSAIRYGVGGLGF